YTFAGKPQKRTPTLDQKFSIPFESDGTTSTRTIKVTFSDAEHTDTQEIKVTAGQTSEVACKLTP
ncbi:MAG TPA: hypothetical protein VMZ53_01650, partial [Kofleriaceae bacterium]|nr:hypothetical protein [Kofleriaceae bacterium]